MFKSFKLLNSGTEKFVDFEFGITNSASFETAGAL